MNFQLSEEQAALVSAVQSILQDHAELPQSARTESCWYNASLQRLLTENGYLDVGREIGPMEAALVSIEAAKMQALTEVAVSSLVVPALLGNEVIAGPVAIVNG